MSLESLIEISKSFEYKSNKAEKTEKGRQSFISKFPVSQINSFELDEFVQGTDENSFCYWLEFKNILFGIGGGNASKFGIYKSKEDGNYYSGTKNKKRKLTGEDLANKFVSIIEGIVAALKLTENNKIKDLNIPLWNMTLQKILSIYFPDKFIVTAR